MKRIALVLGILFVVGASIGVVATMRSSGGEPESNLPDRSTTVTTFATASGSPEQATDVTDLPTPEPVDGPALQVLEVTDGDTIVVDVDRSAYTIRLLGINAPEHGECLADAARRRLKELLDGADGITLANVDPDRDQYDRMLTDVLVGGESVGGALVAEGLALSVAYGRTVEEQEPLDKLQAHAQAEEVGLWADSACDGSVWTGVRISHIEFDAAGNDGENLNGEWIEITAAQDTDLTRWAIRDESSSHRYAFPDGFVLQEGATVVVRSGCGTDAVGELFWCNAGSAIWNNSGDTGFLVDPSGSFADVWSY